MNTLNNMRSFRLTLKECNHHEVIVAAPNLDAAVDLVHEQWVTGELDAQTHGFLVVLDEQGNEFVELSNW